MANSKIIIHSLENFMQICNTTGPMIHCAVQRKFYEHHYIALRDSFCEKCHACDIIHFTKDSCWRKASVKRVKHYDIQVDIVKGLYVYKNNDYPRNNDDYSLADKRFKKIRNARRGYSVSLHNCEHIVNHILTGQSVAYQLRRLSIFKRILLEFIDLFTDGLCENLIAAVFNGLATSTFMLWFFYYYYVQIKALLDQESKSLGMFGKFKRSVVSWIGSIFKKSVNEISPDEQRFLNTLMFLLVLDPKKVIGSTNAKVLLRKAAPQLRFFTMVATGISTFFSEGFIAFLNVSSLTRDWQDNTIDHEDFKREIRKAILFVFRVIFTILIIAIYFFNDKKHFFHPISAFLYGFFGNLASRVFVPCTMEVVERVYRYLSNPQIDNNQ